MGKVWTDYVDGAMSAGERQRRLQRLGDVGDGEHAVISNARCLTEGVDVPTLDAVAFIDPKRSEIDIAQAVGRAIRLADDKTIGTIVIPVFIDTDEPNPDVVLEDSAFKPVWDVLLALRAHDEDFARQLDDLRRMLGRLPRGPSGALRLPPKINVDIPGVCGDEFARAFKVRIVEQTTASWEYGFGLLERYIEENGTANMPRGTVIDGYDLEQWVMVQRTRFREGKLAPERQGRLEKLHPTWTWNARVTNWEKGFAQLGRYVESEGNALVPAAYKTADRFELGQWVVAQRVYYANGTLDAERQARLEQLHPTWTWNVLDSKWEEGFSYLKQYVKVHGHPRPKPSDTIADGFPVGQWVGGQRSAYAKGRLDPARVQRLQALPGWAWDASAAKWEAQFGQLQQYIKAHGDAIVPTSYEVDGKRLGAWAAAQRNKYASGKLAPERQARLEKLHPSWAWDARAAKWEEGFSYLKQYVKAHGHARPKPSDTIPDGYRLVQWVMVQRQTHREGKLDAEREARLEKVHPTWTWDASADRGIRGTPR